MFLCHNCILSRQKHALSSQTILCAFGVEYTIPLTNSGNFLWVLSYAVNCAICINRFISVSNETNQRTNKLGKNIYTNIELNKPALPKQMTAIHNCTFFDHLNKFVLQLGLTIMKFIKIVRVMLDVVLLALILKNHLAF